jgi:UDP:flavonoid glycosyltransferase YjiC (YdhE family)
VVVTHGGFGTILGCLAVGVPLVVVPVQADPAYRRNAERVRDAMAALPGMDHAVALLERLAREKQPLLRA